ncbi:Leucine-rich repeat (LRR) protein associated with apoptosis in muscle tissue protein [Dioscorea alata]|uniref:Leucine-rich repeat (LRR) protein associated with apoptosis in muscle tissue protein n=1 Tax=Dioscorea alata TaxID=55571 RepID=A0ACB7WT22_DIOAL|nr:Leucine-rich repeat (LRR) protein associated with apoptosis in muscle tissue protein [Dioscorea alata]
MARVSHLSLLPLLLSLVSASDVPPPSIQIPLPEEEAVYLALESINPTIPWRTLFPDDLCLYGPHGIVCELFPESSSTAAVAAVPHVTELNFGYVSDFSSNPSCSLNASFPTSLSALPYLRKLFFFSCFTGEKTTLSRTFSNLSSSLEELVIIENPSLSGKLSGILGDFPQLRRVVISRTGISGNIPDEIGNLRNLEQLVLTGNRLHGAIPTSIGQCLRLKILDLSFNRITGRFPDEIGQLTELVKLDLSSNHLIGPIPAVLASLDLLEFLDLSHNRLTGGVPIALAELVNLREVFLTGNPLGGGIPEIWSKLKGIKGIGMSGLGLVGNIPSSMGVFLENICYLALDNNFLEGELPEQFKKLESSAKEVNFENNLLRGRIPFSAAFIESLGGKLKLAGNPKLCLTEKISLLAGDFNSCNKLEIPHSTLPSSEALILKTPPFFRIFLFILCFLNFV